MTLLQLKNFSSGYRTNNIDKASLSDGKNIELLPTAYGRGLFRSYGNTCTCQIPNEKIIGGFDYIKGDDHHHLVFTKNCSESKAYLVDGDEYTLIKGGMSKDAVHFNAVNFNNGAFITNGIDAPFFYEYGVGVTDINAVDDQNRQIRGLALAIFNERIFMGSGNQLHYSGLGSVTDWITNNPVETRAGYVDGFENSSANITGLCVFNSSLIVHRTTDVVELTGTSGSYSMKVVSNAGCINPFALANLSILYHTMFVCSANGLGFYYLSFNDLGTLRPDDEISVNIHEVFENLDLSRLDEIYVINHSTNRVYIHIPHLLYQNNSYWLVYDLATKAFFPPRITQKINSAWTFNGEIYTGTTDGKILQENTGDSFDGTPIEFFADTAEFDMGTITYEKEFNEDTRVRCDNSRDNIFTIKYIKNGDDSNYQDIAITTNNYNDLIFAESEDDSSVFSVFAESEDDPNGFCFADETPNITVVQAPDSVYTLKLRFCNTDGNANSNMALIIAELPDIELDK